MYDFDLEGLEDMFLYVGGVSKPQTAKLQYQVNVVLSSHEKIFVGKCSNPVDIANLVINAIPVQGVATLIIRVECGHLNYSRSSIGSAFMLLRTLRNFSDWCRTHGLLVNNSPTKRVVSEKIYPDRVYYHRRKSSVYTVYNKSIARKLSALWFSKSYLIVDDGHERIIYPEFDEKTVTSVANVLSDCNQLNFKYLHMAFAFIASVIRSGRAIDDYDLIIIVRALASSFHIPSSKVLYRELVMSKKKKYHQVVQMVLNTVTWYNMYQFPEVPILVIAD